MLPTSTHSGLHSVAYIH